MDVCLKGVQKMAKTPCNPCDRLPHRLSCCICIYYTKSGCLPACRRNGMIIPFPNTYVCGYFSGPSTDHHQICRRCCDENSGCGTEQHTGGCCIHHGEEANNCKLDGPKEADDIWCHMRCSKPMTGSICRRCCDEDGACAIEKNACVCCQTIHQRMNF